jgi:hypothetical protein
VTAQLLSRRRLVTTLSPAPAEKVVCVDVHNLTLSPRRLAEQTLLKENLRETEKLQSLDAKANFCFTPRNTTVTKIFECWDPFYFMDF